MQANIRDGVDPYRGTSRAKKQITMREYLANQGEATVRRGQDINANTAKMNLDAQMARQKATNDIAQKKLGLDEQRASLDDAQKARVAKLDDLILNGNPLQQKMAANQKAALMGKGMDSSDGKPLTDTQSKALLFGSRMQAANEIMDKLSKGGKDFSTPGANGMLGGVVNLANTKEGQMLDQAKRDFINATLRRESGAVISDPEFDNGSKQYFPQPGDAAEVIEQKRNNRLLAQRGILAEVPNSDTRVAQVRNPGGQAQADASRGASDPANTPAGQTANLAQVKDAAGYDALPSGATFTTPSGEVRRKK